MTSKTEILEALRGIVGPLFVVTDAADLEKVERDWRGRYRSTTLCAVRPVTVDETAAIIRFCNEKRLAVVPQGGNTGMSAAALPPPALANVVLCLDRMNTVREVDLLTNTMTVEAGCTLASIQALAHDADRLFPLALGSQGSCQIGGNISTNAGGTAVLRFGNMRDLVLGLEVVLPDGRVWNGLRKLRKDNTGYDLKQLFIGAEGTLGVVTAAVLKLFPRPRVRVAAWVAVTDLDTAIQLLGHLQASCGERLSSFEVMSRGQLDLVLRHIPGTRDPLKSAYPWAILLEATDSRGDSDLAHHIEGVLHTAMEDGLALDAAIASNERQFGDFWKLRDSVSEANRHSGYSVSHDTSVPIAMIPQFVRTATAALRERPSNPTVVAVGHVGDGNIHLVAIFDRAGKTPSELQQEADAASQEVHRIAAALGGSISAEHGIGSTKRDELVQYKDPVELDLMKGIKRLLDPGNLMNPGKLLAMPSDAHPS
ncbi:MAG: FAD-binding oxidoreductase [Burkholderiaceae bacterium]